jgi:hypothetical protein
MDGGWRRDVRTGRKQKLLHSVGIEPTPVTQNRTLTDRLNHSAKSATNTRSDTATVLHSECAVDSDQRTMMVTLPNSSSLSLDADVTVEG